MIKQSLLNTLVGMSIDNAEDTVREAGHQFESVPSNSAITLLARANTVILWHNGAVVTGARAGDGLELIKE